MQEIDQRLIVIQANRKTITTITMDQLMEILTIYSDEPLIERAFFNKATNNLLVTIRDIQTECNVLNIPWQLFLLSHEKLTQTIRQIKDKRTAKFDKRLIASRDGEGRGISLRIADRVIALQDYAKRSVEIQNPYCGSLVGISEDKRAAAIIEFFDIDLEKIHGRAKTTALDYLINRFEAKNIRIARGVLSNKIIPNAKEIIATYRKSSGFVVHDDCVPYVFLPSEVSEMIETSGRQILTLISLIVLLGLGEHNIYINGDLETHIQMKEILNTAFRISGEVLLPTQATDDLRGSDITPELRDRLSLDYMLTPSAIVVTLWKRGLIENEYDLEQLLKAAPTTMSRPSFPRNARMETSVKKFCGQVTGAELMHDIRTGAIGSIPAQYLLFGHVDKRNFAKLKSEMGL